MVTAIIAVTGVLFLLWLISGYLPTMNIKTPGYSVVEKKAGYEIRRYDPYVVAETRRTRNGSIGFKALFRFISGDNRTKSKLPMTAPVIRWGGSESEEAPSIPPTSGASDKGTEMIAFVMPPGMALAQLPLPGNADVTLRSVPSHTVAAIVFSGVATTDAISDQTGRLMDALRRDGLTARSAPRIALFNPPWTPPFMRKNEVMVEIDWP